jgi:2-polyprenyl-6-methoxyphenol hydroxylase-like FAD-dependent oxidoreductase
VDHDAGASGSVSAVMDADLVVIGAGPVGAALAMLLARSGRRVALLDRATFPRDKACGEGLLPSGVRVLEGLGIDLAALGFPELSGVRYRSACGRSAAAAFRDGPGRGVRRLILDAALAQRAAVTPGVHFYPGCPLVALTCSWQGIEAHTGLGRLRAWAIVGADGLRSTTARLLGRARPPGKPTRYGVVGHLACDRPSQEVVVTLLHEVEVYTAPVAPDELLVAVLGSRQSLFRTGARPLDQFRAIVERAHPELAGAPLRGRLRGAGPFRVRAAPVAEDGVFLVGDAAGFVDPLTGDGIAAGLVQAETLAALLAPAALELADRRQLAAAAAHYRSWWRQQWWRRRLLAGLALRLGGSAALARRALEGMGRRPETLAALLEVDDGRRDLRSLRPRDWAALVGL